MAKVIKPAEDQVENPVTETPTEVKANTKTKAKAKKVGVEEAFQAIEAPTEVLEILKMYPNKEKLYIDSTHGVFDSNTDVRLLGDAQLYKNPYFNQ